MKRKPKVNKPTKAQLNCPHPSEVKKTAKGIGCSVVIRYCLICGLDLEVTIVKDEDKAAVLV